MKKYIIQLLFLFIFVFLSYRIGFHRGYNYTIPAVKQAFKQGLIKGITEKELQKMSNWLYNAQCRDFGNYYLLKPSDNTINALWIYRKQKPNTPYIQLTEKKNSSVTDIIITDKNSNFFDIAYDRNKHKIINIYYSFDGGLKFDINGNGNWDSRIRKEKDQYIHEVQINSVWYKTTNKKNKIKGKKDYIYINTQDGKKEILRGDKGYYIKQTSPKTEN